jgi:MFS family permease
VKKNFHATASQVGLVSAAAIVGAVFGASLLGPLGDKIGRARIFKYDLVMFVAFSLLYAIAGGCLLGLTVTWIFRIEPKGRSLDEISGAALAPLAVRPAPP